MKITLVLVLQMIKILLLFEPIIVNMYVPITAYVECWIIHTYNLWFVCRLLSRLWIGRVADGMFKKERDGKSVSFINYINPFPLKCESFWHPLLFCLLHGFALSQPKENKVIIGNSNFGFVTQSETLPPTPPHPGHNESPNPFIQNYPVAHYVDWFFQSC